MPLTNDMCEHISINVKISIIINKVSLVIESASTYTGRKETLQNNHSLNCGIGGTRLLEFDIAFEDRLNSAE